jgi:hypothetical protein
MPLRASVYAATATAGSFDVTRLAISSWLSGLLGSVIFENTPRYSA